MQRCWRIHRDRGRARHGAFRTSKARFFAKASFYGSHVVVSFRFVFVLQDFKGGNIRGALNIPSEHFYNDAQVDDLVERFAQSQYVVFHCMFSQQRVSEHATWAKEGPVV